MFSLLYVQGHHLLPETRGLCLSEEQTVSTVGFSFSEIFKFVV